MLVWERKRISDGLFIESVTRKPILYIYFEHNKEFLNIVIKPFPLGCFATKKIFDSLPVQSFC
tara:strand:- start:821 stop:1009 length:189 start_codon:yes stop_codon:yes gene_type:complete